MALVGWILLSILGFVLFLFLLVLFFPIFYRIEGRKTDQTVSKQITVQKTTETENHLLKNSVAKVQIPLEASAKVSWLFGLIRATFAYPDPCKLIVKLGFITILGKEKKKKAGKNKSDLKKSDQKEPDLKNSEQESTGSENADQNKFDQGSNNQENNHLKNMHQENPEQKNSDLENSEQENSDQDNSDPKSSDQADPEQDYANQNDSDPKKAGKKKPDLKALKEKITKEYEFYHGLWLEKDTKPFLKDALKRVFHILRNLLPRSIRGSILFGAASPDVTGYLYGGYCVLTTIFPKKTSLSFTPDFDRQVLEGQIVIKGHFTIFTLLLDGLRILFDRRLKRLRRKLKKHLKKA